MTQEQVKKHGEVIKWFVDNPNEQIWVDKSDGQGWQLYYNPSFSIEHKCVQNDEYAELRKAEADGKIIQFKPICGGKEYAWQDITKISIRINFTQDISVYRIKPEEPKLKEGDWVVDKCGNTKQLVGNFMSWLSKKHILWTPTEGEFCVMWNIDQKSYRIAKFNGVARGAGRTGKYKDMQSNYFTNIAPLEFVQTLRGRK